MGNQLCSGASINEFNQAYADAMLDKAATFPAEAIFSDLDLHNINLG
jgi:hypothetical protein